MLSEKAVHRLCVGVVLAAVVAWVGGWGLPDHVNSETYDAVVGGSGILAAVCAALALSRSRWAAIPLVGVISISSLMAYARLGPPGPDAIDLTPILFPPLVFLLGLVATAMTDPRNARARRTSAAP